MQIHHISYGKEQFVDHHEDPLFTDLEGFNQKLAEWLVDYNTVLLCHSLGLRSPAGWLLENYPESEVLDQYQGLNFPSLNSKRKQYGSVLHKP